MKEALIVGVNNYDNLPSLITPLNDSLGLHKILNEYSEFNINLLPDQKSEQVTLKQLRTSLIKLFNPNGKSKPTTSLFFFSGHGIKTEWAGIREVYLALSDTNVLEENWGLSLNFLKELLIRSPVPQQIIILDCCYSGEIIFLGDANPISNSNASAHCFISACREYEAAFSENQKSMGC